MSILRSKKLLSFEHIQEKQKKLVIPWVLSEKK